MELSVIGYRGRMQEYQVSLIGAINLNVVDFFWVGFLKGRYINIRNECMQNMTRLQEKRFSSAVAYWTDWLNFCVQVWPMAGALNYYEKALKILFGHQFWAPLALRPGTIVPSAPTLRHWFPHGTALDVYTQFPCILVTSSSSDTSSHPLRLLFRHDLFVSWASTTMVKPRVFAWIGFLLWNQLPPLTRSFLITGGLSVSIRCKDQLLLSAFSLCASDWYTHCEIRFISNTTQYITDYLQLWPTFLMDFAFDVRLIDFQQFTNPLIHEGKFIQRLLKKSTQRSSYTVRKISFKQFSRAKACNSLVTIESVKEVDSR